MFFEDRFPKNMSEPYIKLIESHIVTAIRYGITDGRELVPGCLCKI
jgi:hypothetical protein